MQEPESGRTKPIGMDKALQNLSVGDVLYRPIGDEIVREYTIVSLGRRYAYVMETNGVTYPKKVQLSMCRNFGAREFFQREFGIGELDEEKPDFRDNNRFYTKKGLLIEKVIGLINNCGLASSRLELQPHLSTFPGNLDDVLVELKNMINLINKLKKIIKEE